MERATTPSLTKNGSTAKKWNKFLKFALAILLSAGITALVLIFRSQIAALERFGYPGVFLISMLSNATVIFPAPGLAVTFAMGGVLNPLLVGLVAGLGETLGEITGYVAGYTGRMAVDPEDKEKYLRLESFTRKYGNLAVFGLAALPMALFDLVGLAAGAMHIPIRRFFFFALLGKTLKTLVVAYFGVHSLSWLASLFS